MELNPFAGMRDAKTYERGVYLNDGLYTVVIDKCIFKQTRKSGDAFIAECTVLATTNAKHPVGSKVTWYQGLKDKDVGFGSLKLFVYAVLGLDTNADKEKISKEVDPKVEALMADAVDPQRNAFKGTKLSVQVSSITTNKGLPFSRHVWSPAA